MGKKFKGVEQTHNREIKISIPGLNFGGGTQRVIIDVKEYEKQLNSIRNAKESFPSLSVDESFIKISGHVWNDLSDQAKRDLSFIITGVDEVPKMKYPANTDAVWMVPFFNTFCKRYKENILNSYPEATSILPFFQFQPLAPFIVLSQYSGILLHFQKWSTEPHFAMTDKPLRGVIQIDGGKVNPRLGSQIRLLAKPDEDRIWVILFADDDPTYFSAEKAIELADSFSHNDLLGIGVIKETY